MDLLALEEAIGQYLSDSGEPYGVRITDMTGPLEPVVPKAVRSRQVAVCV